MCSITSCSNKLLFGFLVIVLSNGFHVSASNQKSTPVNTTLSDALKTVFKFGGSKLPPSINGSGIDELVELFWPQNKTNVWDEIVDPIRDQDISEIFIKMTNARSRMIQFGRSAADVARSIREGQSKAATLYMAFARYLIGIENDCIIRNHTNATQLNFQLLPLYSNIVLMKAAYYSIGLKCAHKMNLTEQNVATLKQYFNDTIRTPKTGANDYIFQLFEDQQDLPADRRYDKIMLTRNAFTKHGYASIWNNMMDHPGQELVDNEILYSQLYGVETDQLVEYARKQPSMPLTPDLLPDGTYNTLAKLEYSSSPLVFNDSLRIEGMKLTFENGSTYESGNNKPGNMPFTGTVLFKHRQYQVTSMNFHREDNSLCFMIVGMGAFWRPTPNYYKLGSVLVNSPFAIYENERKTLSLEVPSGYKVASMYFKFDYVQFSHFAMSFVPDRRPDNDVFKDWKEWQC